MSVWTKHQSVDVRWRWLAAWVVRHRSTLWVVFAYMWVRNRVRGWPSP